MDSELSGNETTDYCRQIETYLCRKNDGHLIRVVGPSFDLVSGWEAQGVPLNVAFSGIDRCFERYSRKGPRRRPMRIDFCEADVLDAFDEWRRAVGVRRHVDEPAGDDPAGQDRPRRGSLPAHLERVVMRLTAARANGSIGREFDDLIDAAARELDLARAVASGVRGEARHALIARLAAIDVEIVRAARAALDERATTTLMNDADGDLAAFRDRMAPDAFARARDAAFERRVRDRFGLPVVAFA
jgi:hypothetical protein